MLLPWDGLGAGVALRAAWEGEASLPGLALLGALALSASAIGFMAGEVRRWVLGEAVPGIAAEADAALARSHGLALWLTSALLLAIGALFGLVAAAVAGRLDASAAAGLGLGAVAFVGIGLRCLWLAQRAGRAQRKISTSP